MNFEKDKEKLQLFMQLKYVISRAEKDEVALGGGMTSVGSSGIYRATSSDTSAKRVSESKLISIDLSRSYAVQFGNLFESTTSAICEYKLNVEAMNCPGSVKSPHTEVITCSADSIGICRFHCELNKSITAKLTMIKSKMREYYFSEKQIKAMNISTKEKELALMYLYKELYDPLYVNKKFKDYTVISVNNTDTSKKSNNHYIVLFEFKSAYSRELTGPISQDYVHQVISGLDCIPIASLGILYETSIRICKRQDLCFNDVYLDVPSGRNIAKKINKTPEYIGCKYLKLLNINGCEYDPIIEIEHGNYSGFPAGKEGIDYEAIEAPMFRDNKGVITLHNNDRILPEMKEVVESIASMEFTDSVIQNFYAKLDDIAFNHGYTYVYSWKLMDDRMHWFPKYRGIGYLWAPRCRQIVEEAQRIKTIGLLSKEDIREELSQVEF